MSLLYVYLSLYNVVIFGIVFHMCYLKLNKVSISISNVHLFLSQTAIKNPINIIISMSLFHDRMTASRVPFPGLLECEFPTLFQHKVKLSPLHCTRVGKFLTCDGLICQKPWFKLSCQKPLVKNQNYVRYI